MDYKVEARASVLYVPARAFLNFQDSGRDCDRWPRLAGSFPRIESRRHLAWCCGSTPSMALPRQAPMTVSAFRRRHPVGHPPMGWRRHAVGICINGICGPNSWLQAGCCSLPIPSAFPRTASTTYQWGSAATSIFPSIDRLTIRVEALK